LTELLNEAVTPATNGVYRVHIERSEFSLRRGVFRLHQVEVRTDQARVDELAGGNAHPAVRFGVVIESLGLEGISLWRLAVQRHLVADSIIVGEAQVIAIFDPVPLSAVLTTTVASDDDAAMADPPLPAGNVLPPDEMLRTVLADVPTIAVGRVALDQASLRIDRLHHDPDVPVSAEEVAGSSEVGRIDVELLGLRIDRNATLEDVRRLYTEDIRLRVSGVETRQINGNVLRLGEMTASSKEERVAVAGFAFVPTTTIPEYLARSREREGDRINVLVDSLVIEGLAFTRYMAQREVFMRAIAIDGFRLDILSDKHKPSTPRTGRAPMPHDFFQTRKSQVTVETIALTNGLVTYSERPGDGDSPGTVTFGDVAATITNVSNDPSRMSVATPMLVQATTRVNDMAEARVQWRIPLLSPAPTMTSAAQIASFDPRALNPTLEPLLGVRFASGRVDSIAYEIDYSPTTIRGEVDAYYKSLGIQLLDKNTRQRNLGKKVLGFLANKIAIRTSNPGRAGEAPRRGVVNQPLEPTDAFFKLIWVGLRDGLAEVAARIG
jgi:hypothetical protein